MNSKNEYRFLGETFKINRGDAIYKKIEKFKRYELINCVCWEMASRNKVVKDTLNILYNANVNKLTEQMYKYLREFFFIDYLNLFLFHTHHEENQDLNKYYLKYFNLSHLEEQIPLSDILIEIEKSKIFIKVSICHKESKPSTDNKNRTTTISTHILNIFSKPELHIPMKYKINTPDINFALNDKEIDEYLKILRKNELIKSKSERNKKYNANTDLEYLSSRKVTKKMNIKDVINCPKKCADMFFIYDAYNENMNQSQIKQSIDYYYGNKSIDPTKTINKYHELAKEYIDNLRYKELITGIDMLHTMDIIEREAYKNIDSTDIYNQKDLPSRPKGYLVGIDGRKILI